VQDAGGSVALIRFAEGLSFPTPHSHVSNTFMFCMSGVMNSPARRSFSWPGVFAAIGRAVAHGETIVLEFYDRPHEEATAAFPNLTTTMPPVLISLTVAFHCEGAKPITGCIVARKFRIDSSPGRSKQTEESHMSSFDNPFNRDTSIDRSERVAAIKLWAHQTLALTEDSALSVGQFGCAKPTCPRQLTVILVMSEGAPTRKISIHKSMADVDESDVRDACLEFLHNSPS
jgi:hypothetical protein